MVGFRPDFAIISRFRYKFRRILTDLRLLFRYNYDESAINPLKFAIMLMRSL